MEALWLKSQGLSQQFLCGKADSNCNTNIADYQAQTPFKHTAF